MVQITLDSKESDFEVNFKNPIPVIGGPYEMALMSATLWYSWNNIAPEFNNNELKIFRGGGWVTLIIPSGNYDTDQLNYFMDDKFGESAPIIFDTNSATDRFIVAIVEPGVRVDFSHGKLHELLGFEPTIITEPINYGSFPGNITRGVERVLIRCNIIIDSYANHMASDILYSFFPNVSPGNQIQLEPFMPKYLTLGPADYIHNMQIRITDQLNRPIDFKGETLTFVFDLRKKK
jgi:hypothetical protein